MLALQTLEADVMRRYWRNASRWECKDRKCGAILLSRRKVDVTELRRLQTLVLSPALWHRRQISVEWKWSEVHVHKARDSTKLYSDFIQNSASDITRVPLCLLRIIQVEMVSLLDVMMKDEMIESRLICYAS